MKKDSWINFNHLRNLRELTNQIFLFRHGYSEANEANIIVSNTQDGGKKYGLTPSGKADIKNAANSARIKKLKNIIIYSSPFLRAKESSSILFDILKVEEKIISENKLRERFFGEYDLSSCENYKKIWAEDSHDPKHKKWGVESTYEVLNRSTSLIVDIEKKHSEKNIFLVTHGDVCNILISVFRHRDPKHHYRNTIKTGKFRELKIDEKNKVKLKKSTQIVI